MSIGSVMPTIVNIISEPLAIIILIMTITNDGYNVNNINNNNNKL